MSERIDPDVPETFRWNGPDFISRSISIGRDRYYIPAPPYVIASVAMNRIAQGATLDLSHWIAPGSEAQALGEARDMYGWYDTDVPVSAKLARDYATVGRHILALNKQGNIRPPLQPLEEQSITHLVGLVDQMITE